MNMVCDDLCDHSGVPLCYAAMLPCGKHSSVFIENSRSAASNRFLACGSKVLTILSVFRFRSTTENETQGRRQHQPATAF
jgi:hypothetical protein